MSTIFPGSASVGQVYNNYTFDGTAWNINGIDLTENYLEESSASATYLTQVSASNTYLTQTSASTTYQPKVANVSDAEIGYLDGVTSAIQTQLNAKANLSGATFTGEIQATKLKGAAVGGDEGGEIFLEKAATNTTLNTGVNIDINQNKLRIFESGGNNRGGYIDLATLPNGVNTNLIPGLSPVIPSSVTVGSGTGTVSAGGAVTFSNASTVAIDNCFTSAFTNYRLVINCYVSVAAGGKFVFRTSAGDYTAAEYQRQRLYVYATNVIGSRTQNATNGEFNDVGPVPAGHTIDIFNPNVADYTTWVAHGLYANVASNPELNMTVGTLANSNIITGIKFNQAANITGTIRIYGYNNN